MSLFQKSILNSIKQDESLIASRWAAFQHFKSKIDAIRGFKEEVYQDGFFKDIFESCLGYTLKTSNPSEYNLEREKKNETDGKKADGVIYVGGEIIGVVELKDQKSKNLDAVEAQAFNYHASHSNSKYIIISNFDELRFYIDKKTAYEKFSLFSLTYEEFKTLHLLLSFESIRDNIPLKLKEKSSTFEQSISKELYRDFSAFRAHLFDNIVHNNPDTDKQSLLRLTQKLCDRIVFILFAEDRGLLRPNMIREIRSRHENDVFGNPMYEFYKIYFRAINEGNAKLDIPRYNGGLFAHDPLLDSLIIDDECLDMEAQKLSDFDFVSDISVNILGHIFEQSLTDLEEMNAQVHDEAFDRKKSKRKKDGVFYTPEYITRYIVENTLGKLCTEKKTALKLSELEMPENPKKLTKSEKETLANLYAYRDWLLNLKILDPACGSGAFLNQALEFLIREHRNIDEYRRAYENEALSLYDIETNILEHNLYGVDINEDAVEIARLSLWLRTAQKGRALTNLSDKIVCANSLLSMPFEENSFDVVIGNPPYGAKTSREDQSRFREIYKTASFKMDTYSLFIERAFHYLKNDRFFAYIVPYTWMSIGQHFELRKFLLEKNIFEIVNLPTKIFDDADLDTTILFIKNSKKQDGSINIGTIYNDEIILKNQLEVKNIYANEELIFHFELTNDDLKILSKIDENSQLLIKNFEVSQGYIPYRRSDLIKQYGEVEGNRIVDERLWHADSPQTSEFKQEIQGRDVGRYEYSESFQYVKYGKWLAGYVSEKFFTSPRILVMEITRGEKYKIKAAYIEKELYNTPSIINIIHPENNIESLKFILGCINSRLYTWYHLKRHAKANAETSIPKILVKDVKNLPFPKITTEKQESFVLLVDEIIETKPKIKEYKALLDEAIKNDNFDREIKLKKEIEAMENRLIECEKEIDMMVYALYGLSEDEIAIVEGRLWRNIENCYKN